MSYKVVEGDMSGGLKMEMRTVALGVMMMAGLLLPASGCLEVPEDSRLSVVVSIVPQREMLLEIGGKDVKVTLMVPAGQSPHTYSPTPSQLVEVARARAYFTVGSGIEFEMTYLDTIREQNPSMRIIDCSDGVELKRFDEHYGYDRTSNLSRAGEEDDHHDHHDHHGTYDPHIWMSPLNYLKMAENVYNGLVTLDPEHTRDYTARFNSLKERVWELYNRSSRRLAPYEGRSFLVYHPGFGYFGDAFRLRQMVIEDAGREPGPAGVAAVVEQARRENVTVIFVSPQFDTSSAETIAKEIGGEVVVANTLPEDYIAEITKLVDELVKGYEPA